MSAAPSFTCVGGAVVDRKYRAAVPFRPGTSNPAAGAVSFGGVARNVAENLARLGHAVRFASVVGEDAAGAGLVAELAGLGVDVTGVIRRAGRATAEYVALLEPDGALAMAAADMGLLDELYLAVAAALPLAAAGPGRWLFADCNAPADVLADLIGQARVRGLSLALDAISTPKASRLPHELQGVGCLFLNRDEARAVLGGADAPEAMARALAARGAARLVLTLGRDGLIAVDGETVEQIPAEATEVRDVTGAGDANIAGVLHGLALGWPLARAARFGAHLAARTVAVMASVDPALSPEAARVFIERQTTERA
jgi:pseudouridine kinase